jgi:hypothetical protein
VVAVTAAVVALAMGLAVIAALHTGRTGPRERVDAEPEVIRMTPTVAPSLTPATATAAPHPASARSTGTR